MAVPSVLTNDGPITSSRRWGTTARFSPAPWAIAVPSSSRAGSTGSGARAVSSTRRRSDDGDNQADRHEPGPQTVRFCRRRLLAGVGGSRLPHLEIDLDDAVGLAGNGGWRQEFVPRQRDFDPELRKINRRRHFLEVGADICAAV